MSTGTETSIKGKFDEVAGKVKQSLGEATDNESLANKGTAQQVKGHAEQAWGSVKQSASDKINEAKTRHETTESEHSEHDSQTGHDIREKIASTAANVKEHIQHLVGEK
jgi:uncharacterized protein YjbJ (UPF0337 family)